MRPAAGIDLKRIVQDTRRVEAAVRSAAMGSIADTAVQTSLGASPCVMTVSVRATGKAEAKTWHVHCVGGREI